VSTDETTSGSRADVVIVGYGPVGQTLAALLGHQGHDVVVLERQTAMYTRPRAVTLDNEVTRVLAGIGIGSYFEEFCLPSWQYDWQNAEGQTLIHFEFGNEPGSGRPLNVTFHQPSLEARLIELVATLPSVEVRRGATVVDVVERDDDVVVTYETADGHRQAVSATYVVGCDGANSRVREALDPEIEDRGFFYDWAVLDVLPHDKDRVENWEPRNLQICDPARPTTVVSAGPGRRRWEFFLLPDEDPETFEDDAYAWQLLKPWDLTPENADMERAAVYRFRAMCCDTWRSGRLVLAGDAAHLMPPFIGQGLCSGVRDAANVAWKLDAILRGVAAADLLETYTSERRAHVQHAIGMSVELGKVICIADPEAAAERDAQMLAAGGRPDQALKPVPPPTLGPGVTRRKPDGSPLGPAGQFAGHGVVRLPDGKVGPHDDLVLPAFALGASFDAREHLTAESVAAFLGLGGVFEHFVDGAAELRQEAGYRQVADVGGYYLPHMAERGFSAAIVRPDYYLFGASLAADEVQGLVDDLLEHLGTGAPASGFGATAS
jgi:2-polyprenyl-6-methoxyphenol hydroxylase-like FAD-dependent oxidoreductase